MSVNLSRLSMYLYEFNANHQAAVTVLSTGGSLIIVK